MCDQKEWHEINSYLGGKANTRRPKVNNFLSQLELFKIKM
jgi:hypothetical protein